MKCLEKDPPDRFSDVEALDAALADCPCGEEWTQELPASWWSLSVEGLGSERVSQADDVAATVTLAAET